jgi:hypothetical protein
VVKLTTHVHPAPRLRKRGARLPLPQYVCVVWYIVKHRDNLPFIFAFYVVKIYGEKPAEISGIELGYGLDDQGFESRQGLGILFFTTASRPALGPIQPSIQWLPVLFSWG